MQDPLCHEVFRHINSDEARHITVDFQVLEPDRRRPAAHAAHRVARQPQAAGRARPDRGVHPAHQQDARQHRRDGPAGAEGSTTR
ncbi:hypothetical protein [Nocardioides convexus]|uniref:hypothetical protein n=1 Tax=Nocardioides convexus TaxID=2712224 RepID=UPI0024182A54|nr:hypothetical protein [Nocardioides convexus]